LIAGHAFLFQSYDGVVYHVSETVSEIKKWSSNQHIIALVDADEGLFPPRPFLRRESVQIITAMSPGLANLRWLKQLDAEGFLAKLAVCLWSPSELFLTGLVLSLHGQKLY